MDDKGLKCILIVAYIFKSNKVMCGSETQQQMKSTEFISHNNFTEKHKMMIFGIIEILHLEQFRHTIVFRKLILEMQLYV